MACLVEKRKLVGSLRADSRMRIQRNKELRVESRRKMSACVLDDESST